MNGRALAQTMMEAISHRRAQRLAGADSDELDANLEKTLRACWPVVRAWKYLCETCRDTGWRVWTCDGGIRCGRTKPHSAHEYVESCTCSKGEKIHAALHPDPAKLDGAGGARRSRRGMARL